MKHQFDIYENIRNQKRILETGIKRLKETGHKHTEVKEAIKLLENQLNKILEKEKTFRNTKI